MSARRILAVLCAGLVMAAAPEAMGHHSVAAEFDEREIVTWSGPVSGVSWANPHAEIVVQAEGQGRWALETLPPGQLERAGLSPQALMDAPRIVVRGYPARDGARRGNVVSIALPGGRVFTLCGRTAPCSDQ